MALPVIIQGGMGIAVSNWKLARAVARLGELGVISGTLLAVILARRLAEGDHDGNMRRALAHFPLRNVAERVIENHYIPGGKAPESPFKALAMPVIEPASSLTELTVAANFVEVFLAKEEHRGSVGINLLEKVQTATLPSLYGAMLADVDYVLIGAGIPRSIPGALDHFAAGEAAEIKVDVHGSQPGEQAVSQFDPSRFFGGKAPTLRRPQFLAIVSSATLALTLAKKSNGKVDGFVIESELAGGHNAPPRGPMQLTGQGEPIYGPRDMPDLAKFRELGLPFWLAGSRASPERLADALSLGAAGIQVGTAFAFCDESGIGETLKKEAIRKSRSGEASVFTDPLASPTGFPFKIAKMDNSLSEASCYANRERICDLGYLRQLYRKADGSTGYRCASEPIDDYVSKGGTVEETVGRKCLCNGLAATVELGQSRGGIEELPLVTAGDEIKELARLVPPGQDHYSAEDVIRYLQGKPPSAAA